MSDRIFSLRIPEFESDDPGISKNPAVMLFGLPRRQRLPKSLPQPHIPNVAAQTRTVSAVEYWPIARKFRRPPGRILILTDSAIRVRSHQPRSRLSVAALGRGHAPRARRVAP
jgi:hypothetical protein